MKYFRIFSHTSAYTEYMSSEDAVFPNMVYCINDNKTYITAEQGGDIYQWVQVSLSEEYDCDMEAHVKYYVEKQQVSHDGGTTWEDTGYERRGSSAETESTDCGYVPPIELLVIEGAATVSAETCQYRAIANNVTDVTSSATWSITAGLQYATIDSSNGHVTILNGANESSVTIQAIYDDLTATTTVTLTYLSGATSETTSESTTDASGNTTTVVTTVTEYEDGSSSEVIESVITDENGDVIGTSQGTKETSADGSFIGATTNYDANGNAVDGENVTGDTDNNVSTQSVEYDASGNTIVTGYDIDTSGNTGGTKVFNADGVNTDYYAFDVTHGFMLDFNFTINFNGQPPNQHQNHHNILTAKRADPEPWYGFQLRQSGTNKYIQLGTQFNTGSNTNTTISSASTATANTSEYDLTITYNPTANTNTFVCRDNIHGTNVFTSNGTFPDIEALRYLKVVIGYGVDGNGNPYRYSNINVKNFNLRRI